MWKKLLAAGVVTWALSGSVGEVCVHNQPPEWLNDQTTQAEPSIAVWENIVLVAFVDTRHYNPLQPGRSSRVGLARSTDGGRTFEDLGPAPPCAWCHGLSNPTLAASPQGVFYLCSLQEEQGLRVGVARSEDGGASFGRPVLLPRVSMLPDLPHLVFSPSDGRVYVAWADLGTWQTFVTFSEDSGRTFTPPTPIGIRESGPKHCARLAVGMNGQVYLFWVQGNAIWGSVSEDQAQSWSKPVLLAQAELVWYLRDGVLVPPIPHPVVNPRSGNVHLAFHAASDGRTPDVFTMIVGPDLEVRTPPKPVVESSLPNQERFMPAIAATPDGSLGIAFYQREARPTGTNLGVVLATSSDTGESFQVQQIASWPFFGPPSYDPVRRPNYLGDYIALAADERYFYVAWADSRHQVRTPSYKAGRPDLDVYFRKVPIPQPCPMTPMPEAGELVHASPNARPAGYGGRESDVRMEHAPSHSGPPVPDAGKRDGPHPGRAG